MIVFDDGKRVKELISLWRNCFNIEKDFEKFFFGEIYNPRDTLLYLVNNEIAASMMNLPYEIIINGETFRISYMYGVCTKPEYRGQGFMRQMLEYSFDMLREKEVPLAVLRPEQENLFDMYSKFGFESVFHLSYGQVKKVNSKAPGNITRLNNSKINKYKNEMNLIYDKVFGGINRIKRTPEYFYRVANDYISEGQSVYGYIEDGIITGYCFVTESNNITTIDEAAGIKEIVKQALIHYIGVKNDKDIYLKDYFSGKHKRYAMAKPLNTLGDNLMMSLKKDKGYFNLMFE